MRHDLSDRDTLRKLVTPNPAAALLPCVIRSARLLHAADVQVKRLACLDREAVAPKVAGVYVLLGTRERPFIYVGQSQDLRRRLGDDRRVRSAFSDVVMLTWPRHDVSPELLRALETLVIRRGHARWPGLQWINDQGIGTKNRDDFTWPPETIGDALVEQVLKGARNVLGSSARCRDPVWSCRHALQMLCGSWERRQAVGLDTSRGFLVLARSLLSPRFSLRSELRDAPGDGGQKARELWAAGVLTRRPATLGRCERVVFLRDFTFKSRGEATSVLMGGVLEDAHDWRELSRVERRRLLRGLRRWNGHAERRLRLRAVAGGYDLPSP